MFFSTISHQLVRQVVYYDYQWMDQRYFVIWWIDLQNNNKNKQQYGLYTGNVYYWNYIWKIITVSMEFTYMYIWIYW